MGDASSGIVVSGCVLQQPVRESRLGTWHLAAAPDGRPAGILLLHPDVDVDRIVASTSALLRAGVPGVLRVRDLVSHRERVWLVVDDPPAPTLAQLLAGPPQGTAAQILAVLGGTLMALHELGIAHGSVGPDAVVIGPDGAPLLADWGAVADPTAAADAAAWASIAEQLAATWAAAERTVAATLFRAAGLAASGALPAAVAALGTAVDPTTPPAAPPLAAGPAGPTVVLGPAAGRPPGPDRSLLPDELTTGLSAAAEPVAGTQLGTPAAPATMSRFGPGVPAPGAQRAWRRGTPPSTGLVTRYARTVGSLAVLAVLAAAVLWWTQRSTVDVTGVQVRIDAAGGCGSTAHVVGVISTNGEPGTISYRWIRSDTGPGPLLAHTAGSETEVRVALEWTVQGRGSLAASVELEILAPRALKGAGQFTYTCA